MKKIIATIIMSLACVALLAQENAKVSGIIKDNDGEPVVGAYVMVEGNDALGTVSDADGRYTINVPAARNVRLKYSCIGFETQTVEVNRRAVIDVTLAEDAQMLEETVVVGYGSMRRSDLTGAVASVKINENDASRSASLDQLLQGNASGVQVVSNSASPDGGVSIRIRGLNSFNGGSQPLFVVDGVILNVSSESSSAFGGAGGENSTGDQTNGLMGINPQDIASMEILKDASATAIYGSQGANGVVLITTKSAGRDRPVINFSAGVDVAQVNKEMPVLSFDEYCEFLQKSGTSLQDIYEDPLAMTGLKVTPINWQDYTLRTSVSQRYYMSISARPKTLSYMFSLGFNDKQGIVRESGIRQYTMRFNMEKKIGNKLKVGTKTSIGFIKSDLTDGASATVITSAASMMRSMLSFRPYMTKQDEYDPNLDDDSVNASGPDKWLENFESTRKELRVTPSLYLDWTILPWLSFKSTMGADYRYSRFDKYKSRVISRTLGSGVSATRRDRLNYNWDNLLLFNKSFGNHNLSGTVGMTISHSYLGSYVSEGWQIEQDRIGMDAINAAVAPWTDLGFSETESSLMSFLARAVYNYHDRYVLTATVRADGSSRFAAGNKWAVFPSFAGAWRINNERWFDCSWISMLKLRAGWGRVGNQAIPAYRTMPVFSIVEVGDHTPSNTSFSQVGAYLSAIANPELKWETTEQYNAGIDLGLWDGRLTFSADLYHKMTHDLLQSKSISRSTGFSKMWVNQGSILNKGLELTFEAVPVKTRDIEWIIGGNISFNRNSIVNIGADVQNGDLYMSEKDLQNKNYFWGSTVKSSSSNLAILNIFIEGEPMGLFYGFKADGIVQKDEEGPGMSEGTVARPGDVRFKDLNENGYIDDYDRTIIGDPNPDFTYGFNTSFTWRRLTLSASFNGSFGNDIYNINNSQDYSTKIVAETPRNIRREAYYGAWSDTNPSEKYPILGYEGDKSILSDRYVEDGSFLRLANLALSYKIPFKRRNNAVLKGLSVGLSAGNVFVWNKYSGWDPEVNSFGSDISRMGVDSGSYPSARSYSMDVKFTF